MKDRKKVRNHCSKFPTTAVRHCVLFAIIYAESIFGRRYFTFRIYTILGNFIGGDSMKVFRAGDDLPHQANVKKYRKKSLITAVQMEKDFTVLTIEGLMKGKAGDWLAKGVVGELYPIENKIFIESYEEVNS